MNSSPFPFFTRKSYTCTMLPFVPSATIAMTLSPFATPSIPRGGAAPPRRLRARGAWGPFEAPHLIKFVIVRALVHVGEDAEQDGEERMRAERDQARDVASEHRLLLRLREAHLRHHRLRILEVPLPQIALGPHPE